MSFSFEGITLRRGNSSNLNTCPRMSAHEEQPNEASKMHTAKRIDVASTYISLDLMEETIKADLEPLQSQISALTQTMNKLIWDNSARTNPTTVPRDRRVQFECPLTDGPGTFKTLSLTSIVTAEYSPDSMG